MDVRGSARRASRSAAETRSGSPPLADHRPRECGLTPTLREPPEPPRSDRRSARPGSRRERLVRPPPHPAATQPGPARRLRSRPRPGHSCRGRLHPAVHRVHTGQLLGATAGRASAAAAAPPAPRGDVQAGAADAGGLDPHQHEPHARFDGGGRNPAPVGEPARRRRLSPTRPSYEHRVPRCRLRNGERVDGVAAHARQANVVCARRCRARSPAPS